MKRKLLILSFCLCLFTFNGQAQNSLEEYTNGVFIVNEDWYGHQNSTVNFLTNDGEWVYKIFQKANEGKELGCTTQFGAIYGDLFYLVSKQEKDPGAKTTGSRLAVCNAKTMKCLKEFTTIATDSEGKPIADGRSFVGVNEHKGYIGTSNGIWLYDMDKMEIGSQIEGTGNPNTSGYGQLYYAQVGTMLRSDSYVFAIHQQYGLLVIDPETDKVIQTIAPPKFVNEKGEEKSRGFGSIVQSKDGNLWVSMAANVTGDGSALPYMLKINQYTFEADTIQIPVEDGIEEIPNSWYAWTADGFCASKQENKIYWLGQNGNSWFKGVRIFCYDIDNQKFSGIYDFGKMPGTWKLYGTGFRLHPVTDELYCFLFHEFGDPTYEIARISKNGELLDEYPLITNYWFPALPVFPDLNPAVISDIPDITTNNTETYSLPLHAYVTDADNMDVSIVKTIKENTNPDVINASIKDGELIVNSIDKKTGEGQLTLAFNSNGKITGKTIKVTVKNTDTSVETEDSVIPQLYAGNNRLSVKNGDGYTFRIFNINGCEVHCFNINSAEFEETLHLPSGIYIVRGVKDKSMLTHKLIIK